MVEKAPSGDETERSRRRRRVSREVMAKYALLGAAASVIPFPLADSLSIAAVQLKMIEELSNLHGGATNRDELPAILGSIGGGLLNLFIARSRPAVAAKALVLAIPVAGPFLRYGTGPMLIGAYVWTLGEAFRRHFEAGGSPRDFTLGHYRETISSYLPVGKPA